MIEEIDASLQSWYAGQEVGNALADPISGDSSPFNKLAATFPRCIEDSCSFGNFPTDHGTKLRHEEGLEMGCRAHNKPAPVFSFGFGLSYPKTKLTGLSINEPPSSSSVD